MSSKGPLISFFFAKLAGFRHLGPLMLFFVVNGSAPAFSWATARVHGRGRGRARGVLCADPPLAGDDGGVGRHRARVRRADARRCRTRPSSSSSRPSFMCCSPRCCSAACISASRCSRSCSIRCSISPRKAGASSPSAGRCFLRAGRAQRDRLAHADDGFLGELQGVRRDAADLRLRARCNFRC